MKSINWKALFISIGLSVGAGSLASILTNDTMQQYEMLYKPPLSPPGWVFPVVWTILYVLMGMAAYLIFVSESTNKKQALQLYLAQLIMNVMWSVIFFEWQAYALAFTWLLLLWYLIWLTTKAFYSIDKTAGKLMIPYLLWVTFAGYLNMAIAINEMF